MLQHLFFICKKELVNFYKIRVFPDRFQTYNVVLQCFNVALQLNTPALHGGLNNQGKRNTSRACLHSYQVPGSAGHSSCKSSFSGENARASCVGSQQILVFEGEARDRVSRIWAGVWQGSPADFLVALTFLLLFVSKTKSRPPRQRLVQHELKQNNICVHMTGCI